MLNGKNLLLISRKLRHQITPWEAKLWYHLRANRFYGYQFKRQVPMGGYVVDFCCQRKKLIVELDGGYHNNEKNKSNDVDRENYLKSRGYKVIRFWNNELDKNIEGVLFTIRANLF